MRVRRSIFGLSLGSLAFLACSGGKVAGSNSPSDDASTPDAYLAPLTTNGLVLTSESNASGGGNLRFVNVMPAASGSCAVQRQGSCLVQDCRDSGGALQGVSAGEIDLNDGSSTVLKVTPGAPAMLYPEADSTAPPWSAGDSLLFVAAGGSVPAFSLPFTAPGAVTVTRPPMGAGAPVALNAAMGLVLVWQSTSDGVSVELVQANTPGDLSSSLRVLCEFEGPPGSALVPSSILGFFKTDTNLSNTISVGGSARVDTTLGGYWVHVSALNMQSAAFTIN